VVDALDDMSGSPSGNMAEGWTYGVLCAGPIAALGIYNIVAQRGWWIRIQPKPGFADHDGAFTVVEGATAIWLGAAIVATALTLHFHWFWGNHRRLSRYYEPLKFVGLTAMCITFGTFGVLFFRQVVLG
jgi:hypothetical protein